MDPFRLSLRPSDGTAKEEDTVEYWLYAFSDAKNGMPDVQDMLANVLQLTQGYIWHNQQFNLQRKEFPSPHFYGSTHFGENMEDEWFIVYLLFEISKIYPNLVIKVCDSDGEFLLVEIADNLPEWCTPEVTTNRVFIRRGQLHIIPLPEECALYPLTIHRSSDGAELVNRYPQQCTPQEGVVKALHTRLGEYPACIPQSYHHAHVYLPVSIQAILQDYSASVASAVLAICQRGGVDEKALRDLPHFYSETVPLRTSICCVRFTKMLYAMLVKHKLLPHQKGKWKIPKGLDGKDTERYVVGYKLTAGFEILLSQCEKTSNGDTKADITVWNSFVKSLKNKGYFKGEIEGSVKYKQLYQQAERFFEESCSNKGSQSNMDRICELYEKYKMDASNESAEMECATLREEDDDSWLEVKAEDLDGYFKENPEKLLVNGFKSAELSTSEEEKTQQAPQAPPRKAKKKKKKKNKIKEKVVSFVEQTSGVEGVEMGQGPSNSKSNGPVEFDPEKFGMAVSKMLDLGIPECEHAESSDMDSYEEDGVNIDFNEEKAKEWTASMKTYMKKMDNELSNTTMQNSFQKVNRPTNLKMEDNRNRSKSRSPGGDSIDQEDVEFTPVDIDRNLVKNMLTGFYNEAALGQPGPATTLLTGLKAKPSADGTELLDSDDDPDPDLF